MRTVSKKQIYDAPADQVFKYLDDLSVTGMHMTKSSVMMMGSKLQLEYLTTHHTGLGSKYKWSGRMIGMKLDFTVEVTKWVEGVEKVWETIGNAKMIIFSWFRMHLLVYPKGNVSHAELSISYEKPKGWLARIVSFLLADFYCNWCLRKMISDSIIKVEKDKQNLLTSANIKIDPDRQTNWYVITGGPGSGKTTIIHMLRDKGYTTTIEHARHYIDTQRISGKTVGEIRKNQIEFQRGVMDMQIEQESYLSPAEIVFLDRALPDALAYYLFLNLPVDQKLENALKQASYKKVFILDALPLVNDYARIEDAAQQKKIHALLIKVYESLPFPVIHVPVLPPDERLNFILKNL